MLAYPSLCLLIYDQFHCIMAVSLFYSVQSFYVHIYIVEKKQTKKTECLTKCTAYSCIIVEIMECWNTQKLLECDNQKHVYSSKESNGSLDGQYFDFHVLSTTEAYLQLQLDIV